MPESDESYNIEKKQRDHDSNARTRVTAVPPDQNKQRQYSYENESQLVSELLRPDAHGFWPEQKEAVLEKLQSIAAENGDSLLEVCSRLIAKGDSEQERFKALARMISCFDEDHELKLALIVKHAKGRNMEAMLNGLLRSTLKSGHVDKAQKMYAYIPPGNSRAVWAGVVTSTLIKTNGTQDAADWINALDYKDEKKVALKYFANGLLLHKDADIDDRVQGSILRIAEDLGDTGYPKLLNKIIEAR